MINEMNMETFFMLIMKSLKSGGNNKYKVYGYRIMCIWRTAENDIKIEIPDTKTLQNQQKRIDECLFASNIVLYSSIFHVFHVIRFTGVLLFKHFLPTHT